MVIKTGVFECLQSNLDLYDDEPDVHEIILKNQIFLWLFKFHTFQVSTFK